MAIDFSSLNEKEKEVLTIAYNGLISMMIIHATSENKDLAMDVLVHAVEGIMSEFGPSDALALNTKLMRILEASGSKNFVYGAIDCTKAETTTFQDIAEVARLNALHKL